MREYSWKDSSTNTITFIATAASPGTRTSVHFGTVDAIDEARQITLTTPTPRTPLVLQPADTALNPEHFLHQRTRPRAPEKLSARRRSPADYCHEPSAVTHSLSHMI